MKYYMFVLIHKHISALNTNNSQVLLVKFILNLF